MNDTISKPTSLDYVFMVLTAAMWASAFIAMKVVVPETGPLWLATWRVIIGFFVLVPYAIYRGFSWPTSNTMWILIVITSLFNVAIPFFLISWGELTIDAGTAALLMGVGPFLALVSSHYFTSDDKITLPKTIAVIVGFSGVLTIVGTDALSGLGSGTLMAQLAVLGAALSYAVTGLLIRKINMPPVPMVCLVLGSGSILLLATSLLLEGPPEAGLSSQGFWSLIYLGVVPTGVAQIIRFVMIKKVGYAAFALTANLVPIIGISLGALLLGEVITTRTFLALALVLAGLYISNLSFGKDRD